jgi:anti-sigma factor RsiW
MNLVSRACPESELLLHGLADGELDAANALQLEEHLKSCSGCAAAFESIRQQKLLLRNGALRLRASPALRERVLASLADEETPEHASGTAPVLQDARKKDWARFFPPRLSLAVSGLALAASLLLFVNSGSRAPQLDEQLVANHVRSLLVSHLTDVASSDQHTVKPWFFGKLDFAPPVVDLAARDFPLIGGRLDYAGGRVIPALVYKRRGHLINLFIWPASKTADETASRDGYNLVRWTEAGFTFSAVSDLNLAELQEFQHALQSALR